MSKPVNPYTTLQERFRDFANSCEYRKPKMMWIYPKARLGGDWSLKDLWDRVAAAEQLGFDVGLFATEEGLIVKYLKKLPDRPWEIR